MLKYYELFNPLLAGLRSLGGSATVPELSDQLIKDLKLSDRDIAVPDGKSSSGLKYQLHWARSYLKAYGLLDNSTRGVSALTSKGWETQRVDPDAVMRFVQRQSRTRAHARNLAKDEPEAADELLAAEIVQESWRDQLLSTLLGLSPTSFERLCQRLLRESGFVQVEVTGRSGDGGIDGVGVVRIGGLLGFPILFQCKRYAGSVPSSAIRDFRGAMIGRADRGLVITTGTFSRDARREASRDGAPPIDLVDGDELLTKLKDLRLGVKVRMIEEVVVNPEFFDEV